VAEVRPRFKGKRTEAHVVSLALHFFPYCRIAIRIALTSTARIDKDETFLLLFY
jgi:hypothetical protein